jgi:S-DNA-T family DNA segregation ATPase FtsK/SpoIIIE
MNTLIMSLLFNFDPDDLKLIMFDPRIVEFEGYKKLPHLITPVINDAKKVPIALRWAVTEMENRYKTLARAGVKKLAEFNKLSPYGEPIKDSNDEAILDANGDPLTHMPILIVIIDELAELRMQDSWKDSETYIARIAQLGRAAGVHIVVATQRPSTNIITGVIKANLPTRVAFRVMQMVDSRVILDMPGAENLLGYGDMLYLAPGGSNVERVQGALVDDKDIKEIVKFVSNQRPQQFNEAVVAEEYEDYDEGDPEIETYDDEDRRDIAPLLKKYLQPGDSDVVRKALEIVILDHKASTSYFQRRLKIGYNRAAEIADLFEERGIIGPDTGSGKPREILIFENEMMN